MSYCICGGYLGSGGADGYAGRWCSCANPQLSTVQTVTTSEIKLNTSYISGGPTITSNYLSPSQNLTFEEILPILQELTEYGDFENPKATACIFCDMGDSGRSSQGKNHHDDQCISLRAKNVLTKLGIGG